MNISIHIHLSISKTNFYLYFCYTYIIYIIIFIYQLAKQISSLVNPFRQKLQKKEKKDASTKDVIMLDWNLLIIHFPLGISLSLSLYLSHKKSVFIFIYFISCHKKDSYHYSSSLNVLIGVRYC
jgi:hypothetical protein